MNVLVVEPGMAPYEKEINGLKDMQAIVGGMITASYPFKEKVAIVSNDEALLLNMEFNRSIEGGFGRQVKRYEKGIQILAPCHFTYLVEYEKRDPDTGQTLYGPDGKPLTEKRRENATRFRIAAVFDVSQTEGRELPSLVSELSGDVPDFENVYARLAALCPLPVELGPVPGTAKGYASFAENRVVVRSGMSQVQTIKTLIHETAHAKLHPPDFLSENPKPRQEKEVEAESVAYVVCQHFGIDTSDYSLGYVAGWSRGKELAELKASLNVIHSTAGEIINAIQPPPPELTRDEPSQEYQRRTNYRKSRKRK